MDVNLCLPSIQVRISDPSSLAVTADDDRRSVAYHVDPGYFERTEDDGWDVIVPEDRVYQSRLLGVRPHDIYGQTGKCERPHLQRSIVRGTVALCESVTRLSITTVTAADNTDGQGSRRLQVTKPWYTRLRVIQTAFIIR